MKAVPAEPARERAAAALDAAPGKVHRRRLDELVEIACRDYKRRFPEWARHWRGRAISPWLFWDGDPETVRISAKWGPPERVDVYCLFCRVMLVNVAIWDHDYTEQLRPHTTICALRCLAGRMEPGAPGTYRLPETL